MKRLTLITICIYVCLSGLVDSTRAPVDISVVRHQNQMLPCRVDFQVTETRDVNVNWYRQTTDSNREELIVAGTVSLNKKMQVNKDRPNEWNLNIKRIDESDEGLYKCTWSTPFRTETVGTFNLQVDSPPVVDEEASTARYITVREGNTVNLTCIMTGRPEPTITWSRQHRTEFSPMEEIGVMGPVLTIPDITRYAGDIYICRGENRHKKQLWEIDVRVRFKPTIEVHQPIIKARPENIVFMSCMAESNVDITWTWFNKDGTRIVPTFKYSLSTPTRIDGYPAEISTLTLRQSLWDERDYGAYKCQATTKNHIVEGEILLMEPSASGSHKHKHQG